MSPNSRSGFLSCILQMKLLPKKKFTTGPKKWRRCPRCRRVRHNAVAIVTWPTKLATLLPFSLRSSRPTELWCRPTVKVRDESVVSRRSCWRKRARRGKERMSCLVEGNFGNIQCNECRIIRNMVLNTIIYNYATYYHLT